MLEGFLIDSSKKKCKYQAAEHLLASQDTVSSIPTELDLKSMAQSVPTRLTDGLNSSSQS